MGFFDGDFFDSGFFDVAVESVTHEGRATVRASAEGRVRATRRSFVAAQNAVGRAAVRCAATRVRRSASNVVSRAIVSCQGFRTAHAVARLRVAATVTAHPSYQISASATMVAGGRLVGVGRMGSGIPDVYVRGAARLVATPQQWYAARATTRATGSLVSSPRRVLRSPVLVAARAEGAAAASVLRHARVSLSAGARGGLIVGRIAAEREARATLVARASLRLSGSSVHRRASAEFAGQGRHGPIVGALVTLHHARATVRASGRCLVVPQAGTARGGASSLRVRARMGASARVYSGSTGVVAIVARSRSRLRASILKPYEAVIYFKADGTFLRSIGSVFKGEPTPVQIKATATVRASGRIPSYASSLARATFRARGDLVLRPFHLGAQRGAVRVVASARVKAEATRWTPTGLAERTEARGVSYGYVRGTVQRPLTAAERHRMRASARVTAIATLQHPLVYAQVPQHRGRARLRVTPRLRSAYRAWIILRGGAKATAVARRQRPVDTGRVTRLVGASRATATVSMTSHRVSARDRGVARAMAKSFREAMARASIRASGAGTARGQLCTHGRGFGIAVAGVRAVGQRRRLVAARGSGVSRAGIRPLTTLYEQPDPEDRVFERPPTEVDYAREPSGYRGWG